MTLNLNEIWMIKLNLKFKKKNNIKKLNQDEKSEISTIKKNQNKTKNPSKKKKITNSKRKKNVTFENVSINFVLTFTWLN